MSDLKLVSPDQPTPLEQRLLEAAANEAPSAEQRTRVRLALGLPAVSPAPLPAPAVGRRALMLKAGGGLVVASAALLVWLSGGAHPAAPAQPPALPLVAQQAPVAAPIAVPGVAAPSAPPVAPDEHKEAAPSKPSSKAKVRASGTSASLSAADDGADLSEQLRLIDAARSAVAAGNASAASAALSSYRTRFPRGPFGQEAAVLQIQTLDLQGNHAQAAAQARSFLARHPNSPHVGVVQRIAGH